MGAILQASALAFQAPLSATASRTLRSLPPPNGPICSCASAARSRPSSIAAQSAIGVANAKLKQMSQGSTGGSFNTREFFHGKSALVVRKVKWIALALAALSQVLGLVAGRWLFFARANHPQNICYQAVA